MTVHDACCFSNTHRPLVVFFYLTDVEPGDGGLIVLPGSHKSQFTRCVL